MARKIITVHYTNNGIPQPLLTPTVDVYELNDSVPTGNLLIINNGPTTEIGSGWYRYDFIGYDPTKTYVFTFDGGSALAGCERYKYGGNESYIDDIAPAVWDQQITLHTSTGSTGLTLAQVKADTGSISLSMGTVNLLLGTLLKYERNRTKIDVANAQMIIYDNDGVTPLTTFNLKDVNGLPSVQEVCERIPL